jgi:hypothetical protein
MNKQEEEELIAKLKREGAQQQQERSQGFTSGSAANAARIEIITWDKIPMQNTKWVWEGYDALLQIAVIAGPAGDGKTSYLGSSDCWVADT